MSNPLIQFFFSSGKKDIANRWKFSHNIYFLPTGYVVRREGYVLTRACLSTGGYPSQVQTGGGYPGQVQTGGGLPQPGPDGLGVPQSDPDRGYPGQVQIGGTPPSWGWGVPEMGYPPGRERVPPGQVRMGVPEMGYPPAGRGTPPARSGWGDLRMGGGTPVRSRQGVPWPGPDGGYPS